MEWKVTGLIRNGLYDHENDEWMLARITPRFFPSEARAIEYFNNKIVKGALWRRRSHAGGIMLANDKCGWSLRRTRGMEWPEGARGL